MLLQEVNINVYERKALIEFDDKQLSWKNYSFILHYRDLTALSI